jgi:broad specificity phosphatase PhoE
LALIRHGEYAQPAGVPSAHLPYGLTPAGVAQARDAALALLDFARSSALTLQPIIDCSKLRRLADSGRHGAHARAAHRSGLHLPRARRLAERSLGALANLSVEAIEAIVRDDPRYAAPPPGWKRLSGIGFPIQVVSPGGGGRTRGARLRSCAAELWENRLARAQASSLKLLVGHVELSATPHASSAFFPPSRSSASPWATAFQSISMVQRPEDGPDRFVHIAGTGGRARPPEPSTDPLFVPRPVTISHWPMQPHSSQTHGLFTSLSRGQPAHDLSAVAPALFVLRMGRGLDSEEVSLEQVRRYASDKAWVWPSRLILFFCDIHADTDAFLLSLLASGGVERTGSADNDFQLTKRGRHACFIIGGDCFDKGPENLRLLRCLKHLLDLGADVTILAGNHDLRTYLGLAYAGRRETKLQHLFVRMGKKTMPLFLEIREEARRAGELDGECSPMRRCDSACFRATTGTVSSKLQPATPFLPRS